MPYNFKIVVAFFTVINIIFIGTILRVHTSWTKRYYVKRRISLEHSNNFMKHGVSVYKNSSAMKGYETLMPVIPTDFFRTSTKITSPFRFTT
jgi:hypothetical protein